MFSVVRTAMTANNDCGSHDLDQELQGDAEVSLALSAHELHKHMPLLKARMGEACKLHFTRSAPALQAAASWSPVPPLHPIAPISLPASIRGQPPGEATRVGSSVPM